MALIANSCLVCAFPAQSGLGRTARNLFRLGFFEEAVFLKFHPRDPEAGYTRVVRSRWSALGDAGLLASQFLPSSWKEYLRRFSYVHFQSPHFFHFAGVPPRASGTVHDTFFFGPRSVEEYPRGADTYFRREFRYLPRMKGLVADTAATERDVVASVPGSRLHVIHLWTDPEFRSRDPDSARRELGLPSDKKILLSVGSENRLKNLELLPRIVGELGPQFLLVRIGPSERIRAGIGESARIFDWVPEERYPLFFNAADMVLQPSRREGFGYPIIEGVNSGTPVLASNIPVFRELLGAEYPYLLDPDDASAWVRAVREVASTERSSGRHRSAYGRIGDHFREARGRREFEEFFRAVGAL